MTKKSSSRLARDAEKREQKIKDAEVEQYLKTNECWSEVNQIQTQCRQLILINLGIARELSNKDLIPYYPDYKSVCINMNTLAVDLQRIQSEYENICNQHKDKNGSANTPDDVMASCSIYEQYAAWLEQVDTVLVPVTNYLNEQILLAKQNQALDPTAVSDVEVKTI